MLRAFTTLIPVFVTPLFTIYLVGAVSRAPRRSGLIGLLAGSTYGFVALIDREFYNLEAIPAWFSSRWMALTISMVVTALTMFVVSLIVGLEEVRSWNDLDDAGWLHRSRMSLPAIREHPFATRVPPCLNPSLWAVPLLIVSAWLVFGLFW
jgi:hypothetical protein